jgi:hypothetical protein
VAADTVPEGPTHAGLNSSGRSLQSSAARGDGVQREHHACPIMCPLHASMKPHGDMHAHTEEGGGFPHISHACVGAHGCANSHASVVVAANSVPGPPSVQGLVTPKLAIVAVASDLTQVLPWPDWICNVRMGGHRRVVHWRHGWELPAPNLAQMQPRPDQVCMSMLGGGRPQTTVEQS